MEEHIRQYGREDGPTTEGEYNQRTSYEYKYSTVIDFISIPHPTCPKE